MLKKREGKFMKGRGTLINAVAILAGGGLGLAFSRLVSEPMQRALRNANGVTVMLIGAAGAAQVLAVSPSNSVLLALSLALGAFLGELLDLEGRLARLGDRLTEKLSGGSEAPGAGFISTSVTVCVGAMTVTGAIREGLDGDMSVYLTKSLLDLVTVAVMTASLGWTCMLCVIPCVIIQGGLTLVAGLVGPLLTEGVLSGISLAGSALVFCVGVDLIWEGKIKTAGMLPAIPVAALLGELFSRI